MIPTMFHPTVVRRMDKRRQFLGGKSLRPLAFSRTGGIQKFLLPWRGTVGGRRSADGHGDGGGGGGGQKYAEANGLGLQRNTGLHM